MGLAAAWSYDEAGGGPRYRWSDVVATEIRLASKVENMASCVGDNRRVNHEIRRRIVVNGDGESAEQVLARHVGERLVQAPSPTPGSVVSRGPTSTLTPNLRLAERSLTAFG
jgi:hypothetical protein